MPGPAVRRAFCFSRKPQGLTIRAAMSDASSSSFSFGGYIAAPNALVGVEFWPRAAARIIDTVLHIITATCAGVFFGVLVAVIAAAKGADPNPVFVKVQHGTLWSFVLGLCGSISYHALCEGLHGSSAGKRLLGQVVLDESGQPCSVLSAFKRSLAYFFDALFFGAVGYFAMQKTISQQRHGDTWAHTVVCSRVNAPAGSLRSDGRFFGVLILAFGVDFLFELSALTARVM